jgi:ABC-type glutathione transport system ATPase component
VSQPPSELLVVRNLVKIFRTRPTSLERLSRKEPKANVAVNDVSFSVERGEILGIAGESGSGKSTTARCITRLIEPDSGDIMFDGEDIRKLRRTELGAVRRRIQMVFQDPYSSLNPRMSVGAAILEAGRVHHRPGSESPTAFVGALLERVRLPASFATRKPRELSGGQRQRVAIARALATGPEVIVADEAVSSLDVSIQTEIVNLFLDLRDELGLAMIFVSHQLAVLASSADRVAIMRAGCIVEIGTTTQILRAPQHPYTVDLIAAYPHPRFRRPAGLNGPAVG